jgi:serine/threonine protein kinase
MAGVPPDIDKYSIRGSLGSGHFGDVYDAFDRALQVPRALKVVDVPDPQQFMAKLQEARLLEICRHKHVVEVKEAGIYDVAGVPSVVIATELLNRGSVQALLEHQFVGLQQAVRIIREACFGLEHLHLNNVVHCDVKPGNILLADNGVAKLSDFGLAIKIQMLRGPRQFYTLHGSPELINGAPPSPLTDVYAMGMTLYRLVNNIPDLQILAPNDVRRAISTGRFPDRSGYKEYVPARVRRICNKAIHPDPDRRYHAASDLRQALEKLSFDIAWNRLDDLHWEGPRAAHRYELIGFSVRTGWKVEFRKNGRRALDRCVSQLADNWQAQRVIEEIVASTSLDD